MSWAARTLRLPRPGPSVLAVGAFLKNTVCLTKGDTAYLSAVHGDLGTPEALAAFEASVHGLIREVGITPARVAHDLHPDFASTRFALSLDLPAVPVQHHHAHIAAIAVEHGLEGPVLGLALDGFGLGPDQQSWGGELLWVDGADWKRLGHLAPLPQPGGDIAAVEPWRMAAAALHTLRRGGEIATRFAQFPASTRLAQVIGKGLNSPATSSAGRLFDAACGLLGVHLISEFEGQAPMALERMVTEAAVLADGWSLTGGILDFAPLLDRLRTCENPSDGANLLHGTLSAGLAAWAAWAARETGVRRVAMGGGCFLNRVLSADLTRRLTALGMTPLTAVHLSPGDAGLAVGQAWIAALS